LFFSIITTIIVYVNRYFGAKGDITSEHFNTAGRMIKTGLTASVIVSQWTWAATLLQSSNVAWALNAASSPLKVCFWSHHSSVALWSFGYFPQEGLSLGPHCR
jgi:hypothetical protein